MNIIHISKFTEEKTMTFNELYVGQKASVQKTFTDSDLRAFAEVSLDTNPIHLDEEYARTEATEVLNHYLQPFERVLRSYHPNN